MKNTIKQTTDYKMFKYIKGNRPILKNKVEKLKEQYDQGQNLFPFCPVLVNQQNYVIDGQHRITACQELKLPVYYIVVPDMNLYQIAKLNNTFSKWKNSDFLNCYIKTGNKNYIILKEFIENNKIGFTSAIRLLANNDVENPHMVGGHIDELFRNGSFEVKFLKEAESLLQKANDYKDIIIDISNRTFLHSLQKMLACQEYNHSEIVQKLKRNNESINKQYSWKDYVYEIENRFNKGNQIRRVIFTKAEKGRVPKTIKPLKADPIVKKNYATAEDYLKSNSVI